MSNGVGEWVDSTLSQVIDAYPQYINYDLYVWDEEGDGQGPESYFLGLTSEVFNKFKTCNVFLTDEKEKQIWLETTAQELGLEK